MVLIFIIVSLALFVPQGESTTGESAVLQNQSNTSCNPKLELSLCDQEVNIRYSYYFYYEMLEIQLCPNTTRKSVHWSFRDLHSHKNFTLKSYTNKVVVPMEPGTVPPGKYEMRVTVTDSAGGIVTAKCRMNVVSEPPLFLFLNGRVEKVLVNETYTIDLSPSRIYDKAGLKLDWNIQCLYNFTEECDKYQGTNNCVPMETGMSFTHTITNPCTMTVFYRVTSYHGSSKHVANKVIMVVDKPAIGVELVCLKNCDKGGVAVSNPNISMVFELRCFKNCDGFESMEPTFGAEVLDANYKATSIPADRLITKKFRLTIKPNTYKYGASGNVYAKHKDDYIKSAFIKTLVKAPTPKCTIKPKEGKSMVTNFNIRCTFHKGMKYPPVMSIYQPRKGSVAPMLLVESANQKYTVVVGAIKGQPVQRLTYKGSDIFFSEFEGTLPPITVKPTKLTPARINQTLEIIENLSRDGNSGKCLQYMQALMQSMDNNETDKDTREQAYASMIKSLRGMALTSIYSYKKMTSMIPQLIKDKDLSRGYRLGLSHLCAQMSGLQLDVLKKSKYSEIQEGVAGSYTMLLRRCTDHLLDEEEQDEEDEIKVTTPSVIVDEPAAKEDYENYDTVFINAQIEEIKQNVMTTILKTSQAMAKTLAAGESYRLQNDHADTSVKVECDKDLNDMEITVAGAVVRPSKKHIGMCGDTKISALVTSYKHDLLKSHTHPLVTHIVDVSFYNLKWSTDKTLGDVAATIILDVVSEELYDYHNYTVTVPTDIWLWKQPQIDHKINVHRINLYKFNRCLFRFGQVDQEARLQVVITRNRRPNYEDFRRGRVYAVNASDEDSKLIRCPKWPAEDAFVYVAVLPVDTMLQNADGSVLTVKYQLEFINTVCMIFDKEDARNWIPAKNCETHMISEGGVFKFNCTCTHTSLFAGSLIKVKSKLDRVIDVPFHSEPFRNYTIFAHVVGVFFCYCVALCFEHRRRMAEVRKENMFLLSDNLKNDLYCYLVLVRTGSHTHAGTTSNVMIQVYGDKTTSKPHVLNYPDPEMRMLQRNNQDCFAMTSDTHLGDLQKIHLWFDNVGLRPSWYCDNVVVVDLQTRRKWYFPVEKWLNVKRDNNHEIYAEPSVRSKKSLKKSMDAYLRFYLGGQHLWNIFVRTNDDRITFAQRITVLLSMIYTMYLVNMMYRDLPEFRASDSFGMQSTSFSEDCITYGLITSVVSSVIHHPFVYIFRNSYKLQGNTAVLTRDYRRFSYRINQAAWYLLIILIVCQMTYLITFGFSVTLSTTYLWILTNFFAFFFEVVLVENLYLIVVNIITASYMKFPAKYFNFALIKEEIETQRRVLFNSLGEVMMRPYFRRHYEPMEKEELLNVRQFHRQRMEVSVLFGDLCVFLIYVAMLYTICFTAQSPIIEMCNRHMRKMVNTYLFYPGGLELKEIYNLDDIYEYINDTINNVIHPVHWYGDYFTMDAGQMIDFNTKVLGVVQLRQQRRLQNCKLPWELRFLETNCHNPPLTYAKHYDYGEHNSFALGKLGFYSGAGYKTTLGRTIYNSYFMMRLLRKHRWIDVNTMVLFIEFFTYTANTNVFNAVRLMIERDRSGRLLKSSNVYTMQLIFNSRVDELAATIVMVIFITTSLVLALKRVAAILKLRRSYWKSIWNIIDSLIVTLSFVIVYFFFVKENDIEHVLKRVGGSNHNEYVEHSVLVTVWQRDRMVSAVLICLSTIRLWKFLRFGTVFQVMERTLFSAARPLLAALAYQLMTIVSFATLLSPTYGYSIDAFQNFGETINALFLIPLNMERSPSYKRALRTDPIFYVIILFYSIISKLYFTVYATIIIIYFEASKTKTSNVAPQYTLKNFVLEESKFLVKSLQREYFDVRLRAGQEVDEARNRKVYPKSDSDRYADLHVLPERRLLLMRDTAMCVLRLRSFSEKSRDGTALTEEDLRLMGRVYLGLLTPPSKDEKDVFFFCEKDPKDEHKVKFVPDERLLKMEYVTRKLIGDEVDAAARGDVSSEVERDVMHVSGVAERLELFRDCIEQIKTDVGNIKIKKKRP